MRAAPCLDSHNFRQRLLLPVSNLVNCPRCVLRDEWLGVSSYAFERRKVGSVAHVAERNTHIAKKTAALDALKWRILEERAEFRVGQLQIFPQPHSGRVLTARACRFL